MPKYINKSVIVFGGIVLLVLVAGFLAWQTFQQGKSQPLFQTAAATKGNLLVTVSASGSITSGGSINVTTQASGLIAHLYVSQGQLVSAGQKLADVQLDQSGQQKKDQLWSKYLAAKSSLEDQKAKQYTLTPNVFQPALQQAEVAAANAWQDYQNAAGIIYSPASGTLVGLKVAPGLSIAGGSIGTVQTSKEVAAIFSVSEMDIPQVKVGQKAILSVPAITGKTFTGKVLAIDTNGVAKSGVIHYPVTIAVDSPTAELLTNMSVDARIVLAEKDNTIIVPTSAVQDNNGSTSVQVVKNGTATSVTVKVGLANDTQTEILSGIAQNDQVVTGTASPTQAPNNSTSPFSGLSSPAGLAAPGGGGNN